jgi:uncharacterized protein (TIGR02246 family)
MATTSANAAVKGPTKQDRAAVAAVIERIVAAWAAHDADAFAETFTEDATMILPGLFKRGREEIRSYMAQAYAGPFRGTRVTGTPVDLKFLGPAAALLITRGGVLAEGDTEVSGERAIHATWTVVKRGGEWLLTAYQNSPVAAA